MYKGRIRNVSSTSPRYLKDNIAKEKRLAKEKARAAAKARGARKYRKTLRSNTACKTLAQSHSVEVELLKHKLKNCHLDYDVKLEMISLRSAKLEHELHKLRRGNKSSAW